MKFSREIGILPALAFLALCILLAESGGAPEQAIGHTSMCAQSGCHTSFPLNLSPDLLAVTGFPSTYTPGTSYNLTVTVANNPWVSPSAARAGFAAFVNSDGTPLSGSVGTLTSADSGIRTNSFSDGRIRIDYLTHSLARAGSPAATFTFRWTAPAAPSGDAVLVVAGNSANGNGQNTDDFINKQTFTAQAGQACSFSISPTSQSFTAPGGSGTVNVSTADGCAWTATSNNTFITINSASSGSGSGAVTYTVAANTGTGSRSGAITIAGETFTVTQAGAQPQNERLFFAQFGSGQGITSTFIAINPSQTETAAGTVRLFDGNGNPLTVNINGGTVAGSFPFDIPPRGIRFFSTNGQGAIVVGSVQVSSNIPIAGTVLFAGSLGVAGVGGVQPLAKFLVPIESDSSQGVDTGVAASNPTESPVDVTFILRDADGNPVPNGTTVAQLLPNGQLAKFPREIFEGRGIDFSRFRGTLEINSPVPINGMAIRVSPGQFSTLPVAAVN